MGNLEKKFEEILGKVENAAEEMREEVQRVARRAERAVGDLVDQTRRTVDNAVEELYDEREINDFDDVERDDDDEDRDFDDIDDEDYDEDYYDSFRSAPRSGQAPVEIPLSLKEGEVVFQRLSGRVQGAPAVLARTSEGVRLVTPSAGPVTGVSALLPYVAIKGLVVQPENSAYAIRIESESGVPMLISGLSVDRAGTLAIQTFGFEIGRETARQKGESPNNVKMEAGWIIGDTPTVTLTTTEPAETAPRPEVERPEAEEPVATPEPVRTGTSSMDKVMESLSLEKLDELEEEGTITLEEKKALKRKRLGL